MRLAGAKRLATYRSNSIIGVSEQGTDSNTGLAEGEVAAGSRKKAPQDLLQNDDANRRLNFNKALMKRCPIFGPPDRPYMPEGNVSWSYMIERQAPQVRSQVCAV